MNTTDTNNLYYHHFLLSIGKGVDPEIDPNIGSIYRYKGGLYKGRPYYVIGNIQRRRGLGIGSFFQSLFQRAAPLLRSLGSKTVDVVSNIAKDAIQGENIKTSAIKNIKEAIPAAFSGIINRDNTEYTPQLESRKRKVISSSIKKNKKRKTKGSGGFNQLYPALKLMKYGNS